jgi:hypothetical protein
MTYSHYTMQCMQRPAGGSECVALEESSTSKHATQSSLGCSCLTGSHVLPTCTFPCGHATSFTLRAVFNTAAEIMFNVDIQATNSYKTDQLGNSKTFPLRRETDKSMNWSRRLMSNSPIVPSRMHRCKLLPMLRKCQVDQLLPRSRH